LHLTVDRPARPPCDFRRFMRPDTTVVRVSRPSSLSSWSVIRVACIVARAHCHYPVLLLPDTLVSAGHRVCPPSSGVVCRRAVVRVALPRCTCSTAEGDTVEATSSEPPRRRRRRSLINLDDAPRCPYNDGVIVSLFGYLNHGTENAVMGADEWGRSHSNVGLVAEINRMRAGQRMEQRTSGGRRR